MKVFSGFLKELKLASRGFYFYIEIFMAFLILILFLFIVPEEFSSRGEEYIFLDMPIEAKDVYLKSLAGEDLLSEIKNVKIKIDGKDKNVDLYETEDSSLYFLESKEDIIYMANNKRKISLTIKMDEDHNLAYEYYLQGYEGQKLKNLIRVLNLESAQLLQKNMDSLEVRPISIDSKRLSDKENMLPSVLVFNGSLMGLFIIAAYIFLDRQEGVIKAYALTPSPVWQYLISKIGIIVFTSILSSMLVLLPVMGLKPDYLLLLVLLISTAFFSSALGLLIASFYDSLIQAFAAIYTFMIIMILPNMAYFLPSWNPTWIKIFPTYSMLQGFKSVILANGDVAYVLSISVAFLLTGLIMFFLANLRYKKTLFR